MDKSQYLAQALQQMQQDTAAPQPAPQGPSLQQMAAAVKQRDTWQAANPGQSYMQHNLQQFGQQVQGAPQAMANGLGNLAKLLPGAGGGKQPLPNATFNPDSVNIPQLMHPVDDGTLRWRRQLMGGMQQGG